MNFIDIIDYRWVPNFFSSRRLAYQQAIGTY
jgi:hypothetical protein